jgi:hypothetical protein
MMTASNKHPSKVITVLYTAFFFLSLSTNSAGSIPTAEDINSPAELTRLTIGTFMQQSRWLRMKYEYSGKFLTDEDKNNLHKLAERAGCDLEAITKTQKQLKQQVEDFQGDDWDSKFGSTGLWRKLFTDLYTTTLSKCEIDFYTALTSQQPQRDEILHNILAQIVSLGQDYNTGYSHFLKARALSLLAQTDPNYKSSAKKEFDTLTIRSDMSPSTIFRTNIERIKLFGQTETEQSDILAEQILQSNCADDLELVLSLAFLQRKLNQPEAFKKTVKLFPQTEDLIGSLALSELSYLIGAGQLTEQSLQQTSVFEAEFAVKTAWKNEAENYKVLLDRLAGTEKFQTPLILYVSAIGFAESSPAKSVNLLIKASKLQQAQKSQNLDLQPDKIAEQAAQLAYNVFAADSNNCPLALEAFENYSKTANKKINEELEYLYSVVLNNCGQTEESEKLLQKIADRPAGNRRSRATLDLIVQAMQENRYENQDQRNKLLKQLSDLVANCTSQNEDSRQIRTEAITLYCKLLLESKDSLSAQKILDILTDAEIASNPTLKVLKSKALQQSGRLDESARCLCTAITPDSCSYTTEAMELLSEIIDKIDYYQAESDNFPNMIQDCYRLAEFCYDCLDDRLRRQAGLYLAELTIFAANEENEKLLEVDKLLNSLSENGMDNDVDLLHCRARLLTKQGKFDEAAELWAQVAKIRKSEAPSANQRSWKWWRSKFYELYCWAECPQTEKKSVLHNIDILESSFTDIPPLWAEKLNSLKQQCRNQLINSGK